MKNLISALALLAAAASSARAQDVIHFKDGTADQECEVVSLNYRTVDYDIVLGNKVRQQADAKKVAEISVDKNQSTFEFNQGQSAMEAGNFAEAIEKFGRVTRDQRARDLLKQTAAINMVRCQYYSENVPGCLAAIQGLRQMKPETFFLMESYQLEIKAHLAKNDVGQAQAAVTALEGKGNSENMPEWSRAADVLRGGLLELQKKYRDALQIYRKYQTDKDAGDDAKMGELRCLKETADWAGLSVRSEAVLGELHNRKLPNDRLSMAAYNARGEANLNGGKIKEALLDFMQGVAVFSKSGGGNREHETSLARAAFACTRIALAEKTDKARRDTYKRRAQELEADLKRGYPGTPYAPEVKRAIDEVK
jgi:outer membrane protein assembly factor BamD (BamD/ComL family)